MNILEEYAINCPHCGATVNLLIDCSLPEQEYVEDCQVCCAPIVLTIRVEDGEVTSVDARREND